MARKLKDWLTSYLEYTFESEPPELFHMWTGISTIASVLERKCILNWGNLRFFPNMYIVLVAPSGKVRKGTAMAFGKNFLSNIGIHMAAESITREALVRELMESGETELDEKTGNITCHSSLTVVAPELVVFLGYNQQSLMMDLTDWYDCGHGPEGKWTYRTKTQGTDEILGVWLNLIGATTPDLLRSALSLDAVGGGLTSRIIFVYAGKKGKLCPVPFVTPEMHALGQDLFEDLEQMHLLRGEFKFSKGFIDVWTKWYLEQDEKEIFQEIALQPYIERRGVHVLKLSMIFNVSRSSSMELRSEDIVKAITFLEHTEKFMPSVFSGIGKSPHADVMAQVMTAIGLAGETTRTKLMERFYNDADERVMDTILSTLHSINFIAMIETGEDTIIKHCKKGDVE